MDTTATNGPATREPAAKSRWWSRQRVRLLEALAWLRLQSAARLQQAWTWARQQIAVRIGLLSALSVVAIGITLQALRIATADVRETCRAAAAVGITTFVWIYVLPESPNHLVSLWNRYKSDARLMIALGAVCLMLGGGCALQALDIVPRLVWEFYWGTMVIGLGTWLVQDAAVGRAIRHLGLLLAPAAIVIYAGAVIAAIEWWSPAPHTRLHWFARGLRHTFDSTAEHPALLWAFTTLVCVVVLRVPLGALIERIEGGATFSRGDVKAEVQFGKSWGSQKQSNSSSPPAGQGVASEPEAKS